MGRTAQAVPFTGGRGLGPRAGGLRPHHPHAHLAFCSLFAISLFLLCIRRVGDRAHPWARKASTVVYLVHIVFVVIFVYGIYGYTEISFCNAPISHDMLYAFALGCSSLAAAIVIPLGRGFPVVRTVFGV